MTRTSAPSTATSMAAAATTQSGRRVSSCSHPRRRKQLAIDLRRQGSTQVFVHFLQQSAQDAASVMGAGSEGVS